MHTPGEIAVIDKLSSIIESLLGRGNNQPVVLIADKLLLTIKNVEEEGRAKR